MRRPRRASSVACAVPTQYRTEAGAVLARAPSGACAVLKAVPLWACAFQSNAIQGVQRPDASSPVRVATYKVKRKKWKVKRLIILI